MVRIEVMFPSHYPNGAAPDFHIDKTTSIDISSQQDLHRVSLWVYVYSMYSVVLHNVSCLPMAVCLAHCGPFIHIWSWCYKSM